MLCIWYLFTKYFILNLDIILFLFFTDSVLICLCISFLIKRVFKNRFILIWVIYSSDNLLVSMVSMVSKQVSMVSKQTLQFPSVVSGICSLLCHQHMQSHFVEPSNPTIPLSSEKFLAEVRECFYEAKFCTACSVNWCYNNLCKHVKSDLFYFIVQTHEGILEKMSYPIHRPDIFRWKTTKTKTPGNNKASKISSLTQFFTDLA